MTQKSVICDCLDLHFEVYFKLINDALNSICLLPNYYHFKRDRFYQIYSHILPLWPYSLLKTSHFQFIFHFKI